MFLMRIVALTVTALFLAGCATTWETSGPSAPTGGTGIMADDSLASGPEAVSSISQLPPGNHIGAQPPFATQGEAAAYEYGAGYRVGAGDRLGIRVVGEPDLTGEFVVDASGILSPCHTDSPSALSFLEMSRTANCRLQRCVHRHERVPGCRENL